MTDQQTCPNCGAEKDLDTSWYVCGTPTDCEFRHADCYQRQIAAQAAEIERLRGSLRDIAELAHDKSTGPAVPDTCWEIRHMAYEAVER